MQITNIVWGVVEKTLMQCIISYFEVLFNLKFLNERRFIASCRDLSPNRPFQELSVYYSIHETSEILTSCILGWNLGVQNVITYHRTPAFYLVYLLFNLLQNTKDKRRAVCFAQNVFLSEKKDSFWFVKYSVWWQKCFQMLHKTWIEMWKVWQNDNFIWKSRSEINFIE